jgi:hypothetical protein
LHGLDHLFVYLPCDTSYRLPIFFEVPLSRNYKIQIVARVGRKSAVALSGVWRLLPPYRARFRAGHAAVYENVKLGKTYHSEAPEHLGSERESTRSTSTTTVLARLLRGAIPDNICANSRSCE